MDIILNPIDKSIAGVGKFIMERPRLAGLLFIIILAITISSLNIRRHDEYTTVDLSLPTDIAKSTVQPESVSTGTATATSSTVATPTVAANSIASSPTAQPQAANNLAGNWQTITVKRGDNLARIFKRLKLNARNLQEIALLGTVSSSLKHLRPGQQIKFLIAPDHALQKIVYNNNKQNLTLVKTASGFQVQNGTSLTPIPAKINANSTSQPSVISNPINKLAANPGQTIVLKPGDTLGTVFQRLHLSANDLQAVIKADKSTHTLHRLKPGQTLHFTITNQQLTRMVYIVSPKKAYIFTRSNNHFNVQLGNAPTVSKPAIVPPVVAAPSPKHKSVAPKSPTSLYGSATGIIHHSLYRDARRIGLTNKQVAELVRVFNADTNIAKNIHPGDHFKVLYQDRNAKGKVYNGDVVAAELVTRSGKTYQLASFTDSKGKTAFYTPQGLSLNPLIDRAPVKYTYISSYFSEHRWHPLLHFFRPHLGVDYAAPTGTPIYAAGSGKIVRMGWENGYGNTVMIKHDSVYSTLYAHLSRFANDMHDGSYVTQGEVIGYVGSTGLATGPHLHFEIHVGNRAENPLMVALPTGTPLPWAYRKAFFSHVKPLLAQLNLNPVHLIAKTSHSHDS